MYNEDEVEWGEVMKKRLLFIVNPTAGKGQIKRSLCDILNLLTRHNFLVHIHITQDGNDARKQVLKRATKYDYLLCSGGDGTLNDVVKALMQCDKKPILGYIPAGTTNDFATTLHIPKDMLKATQQFVDGVSFKIDLGRFNQQWFTYVAAFGAFTEVAYSTPQDFKNNFGRIAYFLEGLKSLANISEYHMKINADDDEIEGDFIYGHVSNSTSVAGITLSMKDIFVNDGSFELFMIYRPNNPLDIQAIIAALLMQDIHNNWFVYRKVKKVTFETDSLAQWTLDGEFGGEYKKVEITNEQQVLDIVVKREE